MEKGASPSSETTFFQKKATPSYCISVACLQRRLFSQIHESWEEAMASTACPFREGGKKDVFSTLASLFAFSRASFSNSAVLARKTHFFVVHHVMMSRFKCTSILEIITDLLITFDTYVVVVFLEFQSKNASGSSH